LWLKNGKRKVSNEPEEKGDLKKSTPIQVKKKKRRLRTSSGKV